MSINIKKQLDEYKKKHEEKINKIKIEKEQEIKLNKFFNKYKNMIEINKEKLAVARIINFIKKRCLFNVINITESSILKIKPIHRKRVELYNTEDYYNLLLNKSIKFEFEKTDLDNSDETNILFLQNLLEKSCENELRNNSQYIPFMIDLSIYGKCSELPIETPYGTYFLTEKQKENIKRQWNKVNEDLESGKRFEIMIEASKEIVKAYIQDNIIS